MYGKSKNTSYSLHSYYTYTDQHRLISIIIIVIIIIIGSLLCIFHPAGSLLSGFLQERFGRKRCIIIANFPSILGWILLYHTHSVVSLYVSTILMGLSIGFSEAPIFSYVGEITEPRLRGSMASLTSTAPMFGVSFLFTLGYFFEWQTVALLSTLCPITSICLVMLVCF